MHAAIMNYSLGNSYFEHLKNLILNSIPLEFIVIITFNH